MKPDKTPLTLQRRIVAAATSKAWRETPHVSFIYEPDITEFLKQFESYKRSDNNLGLIPSFTAIVIKALIEGIKEAPSLNSTIKYNFHNAQGFLVSNPHINVAIPWLLSDGRMITPVLESADTLKSVEIAKGLADISGKIGHTDIDELLYQTAMRETLGDLKRFSFSAANRLINSRVTRHPLKRLPKRERSAYYSIPQSERLVPKDLTNATITISNIGSLYPQLSGKVALLEIIPPQVFAIGLSAIQTKPGVVTIGEFQQIQIRQSLPMCLAFDHRALDFSDIIPFLKRMDQIFQNPAEFLVW